MLRNMGNDLFVSDGKLRFLSTMIGVRMTVIRLPDGGLVLFDPVPIDDDLKSEIDSMGKVGFIIAPNKYHHLYVNHSAELYPDAEVYVAPGLPQRIKGLRYDAVLTDTPIPAWQGVMDQMIFTAMPMFNECVFLHIPSRTLLITDLAFNIHKADWTPAGIYLRLSGAYKKFGQSRLIKMAMRDKKKGRAMMDQLLSWDFDRIVMAHGDIIETGGKEKLRQAFAWLR